MQATIKQLCFLFGFRLEICRRFIYIYVMIYVIYVLMQKLQQWTFTWLWVDYLQGRKILLIDRCVAIRMCSIWRFSEYHCVFLKS